MEVLQELEQTPSSYPAVPSGLSTEAQALDSDALWQRLEAYISYRFSVRQCTWIVEGMGWFVPPLKPAIVGTVERWDGDSWESYTPEPSPIGTALRNGLNSVEASVGQTEVPAAVHEAYRRLAEYLADEHHLGLVATSGSQKISDLTFEAQRPATWHARALQYSGAADLLRPWRR